VILLDGVPAELDDLIQIHEDAVVAWDRDGMGLIVSDIPAPVDARLHVRVWWQAAKPLTTGWGCLAFVSVSMMYLPRAFLVCDLDSVRWTTEHPRKVGSARTEPTSTK